MQRSGNRIYLIPIILTLLIAVLFQCCFLTQEKVYANERGYNLKVHFIDVGQGDCSFIELPDGKTMLIDAGQEEYGKQVVKYIKKLGYDKIDYLVATHADSDHVGGLSKVIESLDVSVVYRPFTISNCVKVKGFQDELLELFQNDETFNAMENGEVYAKFLKSAYNETCGDKLSEIRICSDKETIISDSEQNPYMIKFFMPYGETEFSTTRITSGYAVKEQSGDNETSAVIEIISDGHKYLFTGDMTTAGEKDLIENMSLADAEMLSCVSVLKVAHHGSNSSTSAEFLALVKPTSSVIMVGKDNDYGLPASEVITRLQNIATTVYRTDELGTIIVEEKQGMLIFDNVESKSVLERYSWVFYTILIATTVTIIVIIAVYPKIKKKMILKKDTKKSLN